MAEEKCGNCKKTKGEHRSSDFACPSGKKHKTLGHLSFSDLTSFTPVVKKRISCAAGKAKGRNLQNDVAKRIGELLNIPIEKDGEIVGREMGQSGTDVRLSKAVLKRFPFSIECKAGNSFSFKSAVDQARTNTLPNTSWLLVTRRDRDKAIVSIDCDVFFDLLKQLEDYKNK